MEVKLDYAAHPHLENLKKENLKILPVILVEYKYEGAIECIAPSGF